LRKAESTHRKDRQGSRRGHGRNEALLGVALATCDILFLQILLWIGVPDEDAKAWALIAAVALICGFMIYLERRRRKREAAHRRRYIAILLSIVCAILGLLVLGARRLFRRGVHVPEAPGPSAIAGKDAAIVPITASGQESNAFPTTPDLGVKERFTDAKSEAIHWLQHIHRLCVRALVGSLAMLLVGAVLGLVAAAVAMASGLWHFEGSWAPYARWGLFVLTIVVFAFAGAFYGVWQGIGSGLNRILREAGEMERVYGFVRPHLSTAASGLASRTKIDRKIPLHEWKESISVQLERLEEAAARETKGLRWDERMKISAARRIQSFLAHEAVAGVTAEAMAKAVCGKRSHVDLDKMENIGIDVLKNYLVNIINSHLATTRFLTFLVALAIVLAAYAILKLLL
jgi:hypothetical protein